MKELQTRNAPKLRILETETDYHILYTEESVSTTTYGFRLSWGALAVLAAIGMLCLTLFVAAQGRDTTPPPAPPLRSRTEGRQALRRTPSRMAWIPPALFFRTAGSAT